MRKEGRGKERATTTHLIKIHVFTHASRVTKFSPYYFCTHSKWQSFLGLYDPSVGSRPPKPPRSLAETKQKVFGYVYFECLAVKRNGCCGHADS